MNTVILAGQLVVNTGDGFWLTVMMKVQDRPLPALSIAVHVTVLLPRGNAVPEMGRQAMLSIPEPSVGVGRMYVVERLLAPIARIV